MDICDNITYDNLLKTCYRLEVSIKLPNTNISDIQATEIIFGSYFVGFITFTG